MLWWWLRQLRSNDREVFVPAARKVAEMREPRAVEPLVEALNRDNAWIREAAVKALGEIGDQRGIGGIRRCLDDEDPLVSQAARAALTKLEGKEGGVPEKTVSSGPGDEGSPSELSVAKPATAPSDGVTTPAPESKPKEPPAIPKKPVDPATAMVRSLAASVRAADKAPSSAFQSSEALKALNQIVKHEVVEPPPPPKDAGPADRLQDARAVPVVAVLLKDPDREVRRAAANTLSRITAPEVIPLLVDAIKDPDITVVTMASKALLPFGRAALEPLMALVDDKRERVRYAVRDTLTRIDRHWMEKARIKAATPEATASVVPPTPVGPAPPAEPTLRVEPTPPAEATEPVEPPPTVEPSSPAEPAAMAEPLASVPESSAGSPVGVVAVEVPLPAEQAAVIVATAEADAPPSPIAEREPMRLPAPELISALVDPDAEIRTAAAKLLDHVYPGWSRTDAARAAVPDLASALRSGKPAVRKVAERVLSGIDDPAATAALREVDDR